MSTPRFYIFLPLLAGILCASQFAAEAASLNWSGGGADDLWSNSVNWGNNTLTNNDVAAFTLTDAALDSVTVNNIVDQNYTLNNLSYTGNSTSLWQNTQINSGATLTLSGAASILTIGSTANASTTQATISGDGSLVVNQSAGVIQVGLGANTTSNNGGGVLDMSGLANFNAALGSSGVFRVGSNNTSTGSVTASAFLAKTSTLSAGTLSIGADTGGGGVAYNLKLGSVSNTLHVSAINVGLGPSGVTALRGSGNLSFQTGTGSVTIRAQDGTSGAVMNLLNTSSSTGQTTTAIADFSGHQADILLTELNMSLRNNTGLSGAANSTSTFSFDTGTLVITTGVTMATLGNNAQTGNSVQAILNLGSTGSTGTSTIASINMSNSARTDAASSTTATLNVAGGTHTVTGSITMSTTSTANSIANSTINITGGTLNVGGDILEGIGTGTKNTTLTLNGGTLNMDGGSIGDSTNTINTRNFQSGTLSNVNTINGTAGLTKTTSGTLTITGTNSWTGATLVSAGTMVVNGSIAASSGTSVSAGATLKGSGSVTVLSGAGVVAPGNSPGILTATQVNGTAGLDFAFEMTLLNSPTYSNATASGNDVLHLTSGTPFTASLTSANVITVDFSSVSLAVGQIYRGGFYASTNFFSSIQNANFQYVGANGVTFAVSTFQEDAAFASGTVTGGWVTQFEVLAIPEPGTVASLGLGLGLCVLLNRRRLTRS